MSVPYKLDPTGYAHEGQKINQNFDAVASAAGLSEAAAVTALTDNSGGTSGGNDVPIISPASTDATAALKTSTANAVATLAAKVNAIIAALVAAGLMDS